MSEFGPFVAGLKQTWSRLGDAKKGAIGVVAVVILAIPLLWLVDRIVLFLFAKSYIAEIAEVFNIDQHMARAMALVIWVIIIFSYLNCSPSHMLIAVLASTVFFFFLSAKRYCFRTGRKTTSLSRHPANQQSVTCSPEREKCDTSNMQESIL